VAVFEKSVSKTHSHASMALRRREYCVSGDAVTELQSAKCSRRALYFLQQQEMQMPKNAVGLNKAS